MRGGDLADWDGAEHLTHVGTSAVRLDAFDKLTGRAQYATDVRLPGQLYATVVRSSEASGRVVRLDTLAARSVDGVVAILTPDDVRDLTWYEDAAPLLSEVVRFAGDEIAVVAGETLEASRRGADAVVATLDPMDHATDLDGIDDGAGPVVWGESNLVGETEIIERGDARTAIAAAPWVVERTYRTQVAVHNAMEPHTCTATWDHDGVTLICSTQGVNDVREAMAAHLGLAHNRVRVVADHVGGGFGAKQVPWKPTMFAALLSKMTGRPVQVALDRRGENLASGKRGRTKQLLRLGADAEGRLVGIEARLVDDCGAYRVEGEASALQGPSLYLYACDNVRVTRRTLRSNTGPAVAFRAPGYVEATFALESAMDELAQLLRIDPIELRRLNHVSHDQQSGKRWSQPEGILRSYDRIEASSTWSGADSRGGQLPAGVVRGRGFAAHDWIAASALPPGHATATFNFDGSVVINTSAQDIGTGTRTALTQVAADELAMSPERIRLTLGDTATGPPAPTSAGSTTIPTMAPAVRAAARSAVDELLDAAADQLGVLRSSVSFDGRNVCVLRGNDHPIADVLAALSPRVVHGWGGREATPDDVSVRAQGSAAATVEVDMLTGEIKVLSVTVSPDCGRIINPKLVDSQVIGGVTQGIGFALTEQQLLDDVLGVVCNPDLDEYLLPTVSDTCVIRHASLDIADLAANPVGSKGVGELPLIAVPAAIANAVHDATGIRFLELPITRRRVLDALAGVHQSVSPTSGPSR